MKYQFRVMASTICDKLNFQSVDECEIIDASSFKKVSQENKPVVLKNCNFGPCMKSWNLDYLTEKLGDEKIVIHESEVSELDFLAKNFKYSTCTFADFSRKLSDHNSSVYLRSTNKNPRAKKPARIEDDFPSLSDDLKPPKFIPYGKESNLYFSSALRIASASVQIWTHFDLYDNVLCQVVGRKRVILIPPEHSDRLYIHGDKSQVNNFDDGSECLKKFPLIRDSKIYRCFLEPGDTIFIPALWWHNIKTVYEDAKNYHGQSIGFNIFWRDQSVEPFYDERDVYGNKNLKPFDLALDNLDKAVQQLNKLPKKYKQLYKVMLTNQFNEKLSSIDDGVHC